MGKDLGDSPRGTTRWMFIKEIRRNNIKTFKIETLGLRTEVG